MPRKSKRQRVNRSPRPAGTTAAVRGACGRSGSAGARAIHQTSTAHATPVFSPEVCPRGQKKSPALASLTTTHRPHTTVQISRNTLPQHTLNEQAGQPLRKCTALCRACRRDTRAPARRGPERRLRSAMNFNLLSLDKLPAAQKTTEGRVKKFTPRLATSEVGRGLQGPSPRGCSCLDRLERASLTSHRFGHHPPCRHARRCRMQARPLDRGPRHRERRPSCPPRRRAPCPEAVAKRRPGHRRWLPRRHLPSKRRG